MVEFVGQITIQSDWFDVLKYPNGKVWVSFSIEEQSSLNGEIKAVYKDGDVELLSTQGFQASFIEKNRVMMVKRGDFGVTSYFFSPVAVFSKIHEKAVQCIDVSPGGGLAVSCGDDKGLFVWQTDNGLIRRSLDGHVTEATTCQFFPSGLVVLTGGSDMQLKIWSVEDGSCPVTLVGHTRAITDTEIVDQGKNIISSSRDGHLCLWDCGTAQCLCTLTACSSVINSCSIVKYGVREESLISDRSDRECGTEGKLLMFAQEDGLLNGMDFFSRKSVFSYACGSAINDCCFLDENRIAAGLQNGQVAFFDVRNMKSPDQVCKYGKSSINCLQRFPAHGLFIGRGDGSCSAIQVKGDPSKTVTMELSGPNCDPVYRISSHQNYVYTSCRDHNIRKYRLEVAM